MGLAVRTVVIRQPGRILGQGAAVGLLAVQHAQGIALHTAGAVRAKGMAVHAAQIVQQGFLEARAAFRAAQGVELEGQFPKPQGAQKTHQHDDQFRIGQRALRAQTFAVDLVELAHAALLGSLITEHGTGGEKTADRFAVGQTRLNIGAHDPGRGFGAQGQGAALAIREGIHLFLHHVGFLTDGALEKFRKLQERRAQFHKTVTAENIPRAVFHAGELVAAGRKHIRKTLDACNAHTILC